MDRKQKEKFNQYIKYVVEPNKLGYLREAQILAEFIQRLQQRDKISGNVAVTGRIKSYCSAS